MSNPIDPSSYASRPYEDPYFTQRDGLQHHAEMIYTMIGYAVSNPKEFERTFLDLSILMHMEEKNILTQNERSLVTSSLKTMQESIYDGSTKLQEIPGKLSALVHEAKKNNPKAEVIASLVELEHLICVAPPHKQTARDFQEFRDYAAPIFLSLKHASASSAISKLQEEIEEIKFFLSERGSIHEALDQLQNCQDLLDTPPEV